MACHISLLKFNGVVIKRDSGSDSITIQVSDMLATGCYMFQMVWKSRAGRKQFSIYGGNFGGPGEEIDLGIY